MLLIGRFNWSILLFPFCICLMVSLRSLRCCFLAPVLPFGEVPKSSDWLLLDILPMHSYRRLGVYLRSSSNLSSTHFFSPFVGTHSQSTLEVGRASSVAFGFGSSGLQKIWPKPIPKFRNSLRLLC